MQEEKPNAREVGVPVTLLIAESYTEKYIPSRAWHTPPVKMFAILPVEKIFNAEVDCPAFALLPSGTKPGDEKRRGFIFTKRFAYEALGTSVFEVGVVFELAANVAY